MIGNYLKTALRSLGRQKGYAAVNVLGLAMGVAVCLLIVLFVRDELTFDRFHEEAERIVRLHREPAPGSPVDASVAMPLPAGPTIASSFEGVEDFVRFDAVEEVRVRREADDFTAETVLFADPSIFDVFSFGLASGDERSALSEPYGIVLSADAADRFFDDRNPIGRTLALWFRDRFHDFYVTGVARPVPSNSSIDFTIIVPFQARLRLFPDAQADSWQSSSVITYLLLRTATDRPLVEARMPAFVESYLEPVISGLRSNGFWSGTEPPFRYRLQPLTEVRLDPSVPAGLAPPSSPIYSWILAGVGLAILFIACVNFTSLAIARSSERAREISIRKVVGAERAEIVRQFLAESMLLSAAAVGLGVMLARAALPLFGSLSGKAFEPSQLGSAPFVAAACLLIVVTGLAAGAYPAVFLSRFRPVDIFRRRLRFGRENALTRGLIGVQFVLSAILLVGTFVMNEQIDFLQSRRLGFKDEQIVSVPTFRLESALTARRLAEALQRIPDIEGVTASNVSFTRFSNRMGMEYEGALFEPHSFRVEQNYLDVMRMDLVAGRSFDPNLQTDSTDAVVVNEAFVRSLGLEQPVGTRLTGLDWGALSSPKIVGVVRDFNFASLRDEVAPVVLSMNPDQRLNYLMVRIRSERAASAVSGIETEWRNTAGDVPFEFSFLDEDIDALYQMERRWRRILGYASSFAVVIACMGLFGVALLSIAGRTKEIGIRKVLGASGRRIVATLSMEFLKIVAVGILVAAPVGYLLASQWLNEFAYRVGIEAFFYALVLSAGILTGLALLTIGVHTMKAAAANPVESLRYE